VVAVHAITPIFYLSLLVRHIAQYLRNITYWVIFAHGKKKPHYALVDVQRVVEARGVNSFTATALSGAAALGLSHDQAVSVVLGLKPKDLFKSMTTHNDHKIWQDVYHASLDSGSVAYIKVTLRENGTVVIQFKEK